MKTTEKLSYLSNPRVQTTLQAADALGRVLPVSGTAGEPKPNKQVGLFYFLWLGEHDYNDDNRDRHAPPRDVTKILAADPEAG
ncbi:MAG: hypothetical protein FWH24_05890, partial [Oscillospiraceae bacterium]|nr:hypothetical protein [Oscillospiraceae bacterium]